MTVKKKPRKEPFGRPTKYKPEICDQLEEYFNIPLYKVIKVQKMSSTGVVKDTQVAVPNDFPTFEGFAIDICGVDTATLQNWKKKHPDFLVSYNKCLRKQKQFLLQHGLSGAYNSNFAKFVAINITDFKDKVEVENTGESQITYGHAFSLNKSPQEVKEAHEKKKSEKLED